MSLQYRASQEHIHPYQGGKWVASRADGSYCMQDLIQPQNSDLQIRENENGVYVAGVSEREVSSMDDCLNLLHIGDRNR